MTVSQVCSKIDGQWITAPFGQHPAHIFAGDSISFALASLKENDIWITTENNINAVAVASARKVSCMVLSSGVQMADAVIKQAEQRQVSVISSKLSTFAICVRLGAEFR